MKKIRKAGSKHLVSDINVVPYIDVMLVLLVVFMVTAPLLTEGIYVDLPEADGEAVNTRSQQSRIVVSINSKGDVFISVNGNKPRPTNEEAMQKEVFQLLNQKIRTEFYVKGDKNVRYDKVVRIMSLLQQSGVPNIGLITQAPERS